MSGADGKTGGLAHTTHWPRAGASAALFRDRAVLLVERGSPPFEGLWSLPGGRIEPGETAMAAAAREVREETGLTAELLGLADVHDVILYSDTGTLEAHYLLCVYFGRVPSGVPKAAGDARQVRFVPMDALDGIGLTPGTLPVIGRAAHLCGG